MKKKNERLKVVEKTLRINEESRDIAKEGLEIAKHSLTAQGITIGIGLMTLIFTALLYLNVIEIKDIVFDNNVPEYGIDYSIDPDFVWLNADEEFTFTVTAKNSGLKNISQFSFFDSGYLYREEDNRIYYVSVKNDYRGFGIELRKNEELKATVTVYDLTADQLFDDKDKHVYLILYINSVPALPNPQIMIHIR